MPENHHDDDKTHTYIPLMKDTTVWHYRIVEKIGAGGTMREIQAKSIGEGYEVF